MVFAGVTLIFLPHCIAIASILPWERLVAARRRATTGTAPAPAPSPLPG